MADRYFDRNGTTAGFGTLTGAWDTTTASWSTSNVGTATPAAFTFQNVDAAFFGSTAVASTTAGTATISTGITVTLNGVYTRNLTAAQTIAAAGTGNLVFAGTTPFLNLGQSLAISAPISGTDGLAATMLNSTGRVGAATNTVTALQGTSSGLTGPCSVVGGRFTVNPATAAGRYIPSSINVASDASFEYLPQSSADFTFPVAPTGTGFVAIWGSYASGGGVTFSPSQLASFGGIVRVGCWGAPNFQNGRIRINELPAGLDWFAISDQDLAMLAEATYIGSAATYATNLTLDVRANANLTRLTGGTYSLIVPNTSGAIVITGTVQRLNTAGSASARMSLTLGGSNTGDNTLSGDISEVGTNSAILGITKVDAGRWVLSGANSSHTGVHTISAGTLSAQSEKALGSATSAGGVTISGTGALELSGGITLDKSSTPFTIHQTSPIVSVGDNTVRTAGVTLGGTTTFEVTTGNRLAIANTGAITDGASTFGITKTGAGELALAAFSNTYDGAVTVSAGTLAIGSVGALGTGVATVQVTSNLKYTGAAATLSRATQLNGSAPSLEAAGTGALTVSNLSHDVATKTVTLKGANTDANTITSSLSDNSGVLSLTKEGAGKWVTTGARSYTGTTAVNGGILRLETTNSATASGAVTIGASGTVELVTNTLASTGATSGEVLGTGNVTVNGGTIKTRGGTTQKGQVRYGGNLTFGAGSTLYIGAAA